MKYICQCVIFNYFETYVLLRPETSLTAAIITIQNVIISCVLLDVFY